MKHQKQENGNGLLPERKSKEFVGGMPMLRVLLLAALLPGAAVKADTGDPKQATKENPFVNSLEMKFVPVPGTNVLFSTTEVTVDQYKAALGYNAPEFAQEGNHPAVNVSWEDAQKYVNWLSEREGKTYRLPTDHEWSCAVGIGHLENAEATPESKDRRIANIYPWGSGWPPPKGAENYFGEECEHKDSIKGYKDGHVYTAPVGSYAANPLGIHDLGGNVAEWCEDKYSGPTDDFRVLRGATWYRDSRVYLLSSSRLSGIPFRLHYYGFRVVVAR